MNTKSSFTLPRILPLLFFILIEYVQFGFVFPVNVSLFVRATQFDYPVLFPQIVSKFEIHLYMAGIFILSPLLTFLFTPLLCTLSDKIGRRKVLLVVTAGYFAAIMIINNGVFVHSVKLFFIGRALVGMLSISQPMSAAVIADLTTPETRGKQMRWVMTASGLAIALGPLIINYLTQKDLGYHYAFVPIHIFMSFLGFVLILLFFKETTSTPIHPPPFRLLKSVRFLQFLGASLLVQLGMTTYFQFILIELRQRFDYGTKELGFFYVHLGIALMVGALVIVPFVIKRFPLIKITIGAFFLQAVATLLSCCFEKALFLWLMAIPIAFGYAVGFTALMTLFSFKVDSENLGFAMGLFSATVTLALVFSGALLLTLSWLSIGTLMIFSGLIAFIGSLLFLKTDTLRAH